MGDPTPVQEPHICGFNFRTSCGALLLAAVRVSIPLSHVTFELIRNSSCDARPDQVPAVL